MQANKKQLERLLMDFFREAYSDFPRGRLLESESPDFILWLKSKNRIGIELTRLFPANANMPDEEEQSKIILKEELIAMALEIFERSSGSKLFVKFLFSEKKSIGEERKMSAAVRVAGIIRDKTQSLNKNVLFSVTVNAGLPDGIDEVLILSHPGLQTSVWERSNNLGISANVVDDIKRTISKKDEKLKLYRKNHLNYYWLLITTDRLRGTKNINLHNKIVHQHFKSMFQQVFLFDVMRAKVIELI